MAKISVIVPVYKVEPYLRCCIDSILTQTFRDFELILVDDGSPDSCGAICDEYAAKDDRIVVIHQENAGVSAARNAGLDWVFANSDSEWITFVDSDDLIPQQYLDHLFAFGTQQNVDIVSTLAQYLPENGKTEDVSCEIITTEKMTGRKACKSFYTNDDIIGIQPWGKLIKNELLSDIRFPEGKIHEDQDLVPKVVYKARDTMILRAWMYGYRDNPQSLMRSSMSIKRFDDIDALDSCICFFKKHNDYELAELAEHKKKILWADYISKAWQAGIYKKLPERYQLPLWKAFWILFADTMKKGGVQFVFQRIGNMFRRFAKKK